MTMLATYIPLEPFNNGINIIKICQMQIAFWTMSLFVVVVNQSEFNNYYLLMHFKQSLALYTRFCYII